MDISQRHAVMPKTDAHAFGAQITPRVPLFKQLLIIAVLNKRT